MAFTAPPYPLRSEVAEHEPELERAEAPPERHAVIHQVPRIGISKGLSLRMWRSDGEIRVRRMSEAGMPSRHPEVFVDAGEGSGFATPELPEDIQPL